MVFGLTSHSLYTRRAQGLECDTLIIDEAGQMTIPLALMGMIKAKKVIFAGDYKQLPPIVSSVEIDDEMKQSVFQSLITDQNCTMLNVSFRMCEPICNFVSELFYEGELKPMKPGCGNAIMSSNPLYSFDAPVIIHHIDDCGEQTSDKEAEFIVSMIEGYLKMGLSAYEIAVLSPFRAQAANVRRYLRKNESINEEDFLKIAVDTVDKMQGQEREVIIFSLAAGNFDYMTEMADFLYNPNKLNVAFSRAKSKLIIVGNIEKLKLLDSTAFPHIQRMLASQYVTFV
jgi:superfamily I DNA and/or RNA helicase